MPKLNLDCFADFDELTEVLADGNFAVLLLRHEGLESTHSGPSVQETGTPQRHLTQGGLLLSHAF